MSFAFLALYTGDYLRDTRHLTPLRHGVYLLLLMHCWDSCGPVPLDEQECAGIANCRSADEIEALRYVIDRYFTRMDDGFYNHRMQAEIERAMAISSKRKSAGFKGYLARAKQLPSKSSARASTSTTTTTITPTTIKTVPATSAETWNAYAAAYHNRYGVNPVRNASVNSMIVKLIAKLGLAEAPAVAAFYLTHDKSFYVGAKHSVQLLLRDAEGLRTDWATGQHTTHTNAMQADKRQATGDVFSKLIREAEDARRKP